MEENLVKNQCQKLSGSLMLNIIYSLESVGKDSEKLCATRNPRFLLKLVVSFCLPFSGFVFFNGIVYLWNGKRSSTGPEVGEVIAKDSTQETKHAVKDSGEERTSSNVAWAFCSSHWKIGRKDLIKADMFLSLDLHTVYLIILYWIDHSGWVHSVP